MELIQQYIDLGKPEPKSHTNGYSLGACSDGINTIEFMYKNLNYMATRPSAPVYSMGNPDPRNFSRSIPQRELTLDILFDDPNIYDMFKKDDKTLTIISENFEAYNLKVTDTRFMEFGDILIVNITITIHGEFKVSQNS